MYIYPICSRLYWKMISMGLHMQPYLADKIYTNFYIGIQSLKVVNF